METKEINGILYKLVPEEKEKSCHGCIFKDPDGDFCRIITDVCNKGLIYKKADKSISDPHLKPFNLEAAKAGKPICTRDKRKVRIICFNKVDKRPIVALISDNEGEFVYEYLADGKSYNGKDDSYDLMMLPEKKEGWVNLYDDIPIYDTKEEALNRRSEIRGLIDTIKVSWEE